MFFSSFSIIWLKSSFHNNPPPNYNISLCFINYIYKSTVCQILFKLLNKNFFYFSTYLYNMLIIINSQCLKFCKSFPHIMCKNIFISYFSILFLWKNLLICIFIYFFHNFSLFFNKNIVKYS